ncbi:hypothetical protein NDU88_006299 [Pleurodeles waltl]|uniref:Uncharacterized protein n=1 Tax=Pleurodeles waltl TaxID=8319 RepID=A0AAV7UMK1_PLEWA|nr:hypothetical protein NDU88_006299 [Pleurodeles waltl]
MRYDQPCFRRSVAVSGAFREPGKGRKGEAGGREGKGAKIKREWEDGRRREQNSRGSGRTGQEKGKKVYLIETTKTERPREEAVEEKKTKKELYSRRYV